MKLYETKSMTVVDDETCEGCFHTTHFREYASSASDASKARTRLKKLDHEQIVTAEVEIDPTRSGIIKFLNERSAHETWVVDPVTEKLGG